MRGYLLYPHLDRRLHHCQHQVLWLEYLDYAIHEEKRILFDLGLPRNDIQPQPSALDQQTLLDDDSMRKPASMREISQ